MARRSFRWSFFAAAIASLIVVATASAATELRVDPPQPPADFSVGPRAAVALADSDPQVREQRRARGPLTAAVEIEPGQRWEVKYYAPPADGGVLHQTNLVVVDAVDGSLLESWTGDALAWPLARGREGQFGHILNAPYVWLPLSALFLLVLLDFRRLRRLAHLDLAVLLSFGIGHVFFNDAAIGTSVPLAYPPLLYLLGRMIWIGFRGARHHHQLRPSAPTAVLCVLIVLLVAFRVTINVADSGVIDVGYAGVIGADLIADGEPIYGEDAFPTDNPHGDTYGPAAYFAYVPFEQALGWSGGWDTLPAAHAAAIFFDLATIVGLFVLGSSLAGRRGGAIAAFAWAAYPYTAFALQSNTNDALVAALVVWLLVLFSSPLARGVLVALAALTKFAPLALVPLAIAGRSGLSLAASRRAAQRPALIATAALAATAALLLAHPAIDPGLSVFWERTIVAQAQRDSPFSIWGQLDLGALRTVVQVLVAAGVLALAFLPRRRDLVQVAALAAAALIATQLTIEHWFYLYIPWFVAPLFAALLAPAPTRPLESSATA